MGNQITRITPILIVIFISTTLTVSACTALPPDVEILNISLTDDKDKINITVRQSSTTTHYTVDLEKEKMEKRDQYSTENTYNQLSFFQPNYGYNASVIVNGSIIHQGQVELSQLQDSTVYWVLMDDHQLLVNYTITHPLIFPEEFFVDANTTFVHLIYEDYENYPTLITIDVATSSISTGNFDPDVDQSIVGVNFYQANGFNLIYTTGYFGGTCGGRMYMSFDDSGFHQVITTTDWDSSITDARIPALISVFESGFVEIFNLNTQQSRNFKIPINQFYNSPVFKVILGLVVFLAVVSAIIFITKRLINKSDIKL